MKYFNGLNMGEGIAGPSTVGMATTVTYSCMGIAFVNTALRFGGLYHYPAEALGNANVRGTIVQMSNDIWPDQIVLTPAKPDTYSGNGGSTKEDITAVGELLRTLCGNVTVAPAAVSSQLTWAGTAPVFNTPPGGIDTVEEEVDLKLRYTMSSGKRELEADIWYYGGDGETEGVLEQGLGKSKKKGKSRCVIL